MKLPAFLRPLSLKERIARELVQAEHLLLDAESERERSQAAFVLYQMRIKRLRAALSNQEPLP